MGLFFFILISLFGFAYPLTPLNITIINYFTVGFSGILIAYWALRPSRKILPANKKPFLKRIMPLVVACAVVQAIGAAIIFLLSPQYLKLAPSNTLVGLSFMVFGFFFLLFAAKVYGGSLTRKEKFQFSLLGVFQVIILLLMLQIPFLIRFFNITIPFPSFSILGETLLILLAFGLVQYLMVQKFFLKGK